LNGTNGKAEKPVAPMPEESSSHDSDEEIETDLTLE
jgi:hypothetical protein